ncbi:hypothetical protein [Parashewanella tropica]|uniref:hypothetical protein n=1 Tax=Parashewanella tropica TaxID=2547970 RepID=UPI001059FADE|nr:hypothetical protein [Parashewanella tropica]
MQRFIALPELSSSEEKQVMEPSFPTLRPKRLTKIDFMPFKQSQMTRDDAGLQQKGVCAGLNIEFARYASSHDEPMDMVFKLQKYDMTHSSLPDRVNFYQVNQFDFYTEPRRYHSDEEPGAYSKLVNYVNGVVTSRGDSAHSAPVFDKQKVLNKLRRHNLLSVIDDCHASTLVYVPRKRERKVTKDELPGDLYFFDSNYGCWHWQDFNWETHKVELESKIYLALQNRNAEKNWCIYFSPIDIARADLTKRNFQKAS